MIGRADSSWSYGQVVLRKIQNGSYYQGVMSVYDGYDIYQTTDDSTDWITGDLRGMVIPGNLTVNGTITENSSIRYKENIQNLNIGLDQVKQLRPVSYCKKGSDDVEFGLIAEEVSMMFPEVVTYNQQGEPDGVQYQRLSVILLKAIQELTERVNKLENK